MMVARGDIWLADLNPVQGSEQADMRPVLILQNDKINRFTATIETVEGCLLFTLGITV